MSKLVDSIRSAQSTVSSAFDQLASDVEQEEGSTVDGSPGVEKVTVTYSDGTSADFTPSDVGVDTPGAETPADEVKDLTEEAPVNGEEKSTSEQAPPTSGDTPPPGNAEQV